MCNVVLMNHGNKIIIMKKVIIGSISLIVFSAAISIIQIGCQQTTASPKAELSASTNLGIILVALNDSTLVGMKYDGTEMKQIPITMPSGKSMQAGTARLTPDGTKVFFMGYDKKSGSSNSIFVANIDGSNMQPVFSSVGDIYFLDCY